MILTELCGKTDIGFEDKLSIIGGVAKTQVKIEGD